MFGRKSPKKDEDQVLPRVSITGALGKLKSEADFVQLDANWREVKELDATLQGMYLNLTRAQHQSQFSGCGLIMTGGADRQGMVALIYPSADSAGRLYPFMVFNRLADNQFYHKPDALYASGIHSIEKSLAQATSLDDTPKAEWLSRLKTLPEHQVYLDAKLAKRESMTLTEKMTLEDWLKSIAGDDQELRLNMLTGIVRLIQTLKQGRVHRAYQGIWLPLLVNESTKKALAFWLQLLSAVMSGHSWRPDIIWTLHQQPRIFVLTKPLTNSALEATVYSNSEINSFLGWRDVLGQDDGSNERARTLALQWLKRTQTSLLDISIEWYQAF